jgi:hypothetical protein
MVTFRELDTLHCAYAHSQKKSADLAPNRFPKNRLSVASPAKRSLGSSSVGSGAAKASGSSSSVEVDWKAQPPNVEVSEVHRCLKSLVGALRPEK